MSSAASKERRRAIDLVSKHGWSEVGVNPRTGYTKMKCACGQHPIMWLPKTPSNPYTYRNKARRMISLCSTREAD